MQLASHLSNLLTSCLTIIRTIQNAESCINRIPFELLTSILDSSCFSNNDLDRQDPFPRRSDPSKLHSSIVGGRTSLLRVCRHWRRVLLNHPSFFSVVVLKQRPNPTSWIDSYVCSFIAKSGSHPLSVYSGTTQGLQLVAKQTYRLQRLQFSPSDSDVFGVSAIGALQALSEPAPLLEELDIHIAANDKFGHSLPLLFAGQVPRLRRLSLSGCRSWIWNHFHLTHLCLTGWRTFEVPLPSAFQHLMALLREQVSIEELSLRRIDPWIGEVWTPFKDATISLPTTLRRFSVTDCTNAQIKHLFSALIIPAGTSLHVLAVSVWSNAYDIFSGWEDSGRFEHMNDLRAVTVREPDAVLAFGSSGATRVCCSTTSTVRLYASAIGSLPFSRGIRELHLGNSNIRERVDFRRDWNLPLGHLPSLQHLYIDYLYSYFLVTIFDTLAGISSSESHLPDLHTVPCKHLRKLTVIKDSTPFLNDESNAFYTCLETRHQAGFPIGHVLVMAHHTTKIVTARMRRALDRYVEVVELGSTVRPEWMEIPAHLNERVHEIHWPEWV